MSEELEPWRVPLLTCSELLVPIGTAWQTIASVQRSIQKQDLDELTLKGHFVLMIASFEAMMSDLMSIFLRENPDRLPAPDYSIAKGLLLDSFSIAPILERLIEKRVIAVSYEPLQKMMVQFCQTLTIRIVEDATLLGKLNEFKERRNLLLHNNLVVNNTYVEKTAPSLAEPPQVGAKLHVSSSYVRETGDCLAELVAFIENEIRARFGKQTRLAVLKTLWEAVFDTPIMPFEEFWIIDAERDRIRGSKTPLAALSSISTTEKVFYQIWMEHYRGGVKIEHMNMRRLTSKTQKKLFWFLESLSRISVLAD